MLWSEYHPKTAPLGLTAESRKDQSGNKSKTWHLVDFAALYAIFAASYTYHSGIYIVGAIRRCYVYNTVAEWSSYRC